MDNPVIESVREMIDELATLSDYVIIEQRCRDIGEYLDLLEQDTRIRTEVLELTNEFISVMNRVRL